MSAGEPGDWERTIAQTQERTPALNGENWLRHRENTEGAVIDEMLLEGRYSLEEMAHQLKLDKRFKEKPLLRWINRIVVHMEHLQEAGIKPTPPHGLKIKHDAAEKWKFDV